MPELRQQVVPQNLFKLGPDPLFQGPGSALDLAGIRRTCVKNQRARKRQFGLIVGSRVSGCGIRVSGFESGFLGFESRVYGWDLRFPVWFECFRFAEVRLRVPSPNPEHTLGIKVSRSSFRASDTVFQISGFDFRVSGFGFRVSGSVFRVLGFGCRVSDSVSRVSGFEFLDSGASHRAELRPPLEQVGLQGLVSSFSRLSFQDSRSGSRVSGFGFRVSSFGSTFQGFSFRATGAGCRVRGCRMTVTLQISSSR